MNIIRSLFIFGVITLLASGCRTPARVSNKFRPSLRGCFDTGAGQGYDDILYDNRVAQTFTPKSAGTVLSISFAACRYYKSTTAPLFVRLTETAEGIPTNTLAEALIEAKEFPTSSLKMPIELNILVDISSQSIKLQANREYALVFGSYKPEANYRLYGVTHPYPEGSRFFSQNSNIFRKEERGDLLFEILIRPRFTLFLRKDK